MLDKTKEPLVSIIMPCYNVGEYIERAIESIFKQTYKNIELVCVDDGSIDNTAEIIKKKSGIHNIIFIQQSNKGVVEARRAAINHAKGNYIALVDADDYIDSDAIKKSIIKINNINVDAVIWEFFSSDGVQELPLLTYKHEEVLSGLEALEQTIGSWKITGIGLFKKEIYLDAYDLYDIKKIQTYNADEYITRLFFFTAKKIYKAKIRYFYFNNIQSASKKFKITWLTAFKTDDAIKKLCIDAGIYEKNKFLLLDQFCTNLIKIKNGLKNNIKDISSLEKKLILEQCNIEIKNNSIYLYLNWFLKSNRTIKNKINFLMTILYFLGNKHD